jgi:uncharacterized protein YjbI with pentapeptide repeats
MAGPDTKNTDTPYPVWGFGPPSPEPDTKKLDALLASLNGSADRFQTLWFSFLGLTLYLAIAALATTHRDLLLNTPQTLPILNIKVELLPFYVIAPLLYLVFHFYLLMMLALLARTAAEFDKQLRATLLGEPERERYRAQVGNALFLQLLVGMKGERIGINALLMGLIALITIVLAPLATLVLMRMMFLPYHHLRITWWHRAVVVADLVLIVVMTYRCFFPGGVRKAPLVLGALSRKPRWAAAMALCVLLAVVLAPIMNWLSFRQGRWAGEPRPSSVIEWAQWMAGKPTSVPDVDPDYAATANGVVFGLFPDRLKLNDEVIVGERKLEETKKEIASRGDDFVPTLKLDHRDLQAANLSADLRGASLDGAMMRGASLNFARLEGAHVSCEYQADAVPRCAYLQGARLEFARLQGADFSYADLQGVSFRSATLQGTNLIEARLQGADLVDAKLQGANLYRTQLLGVDAVSAQLQGAILNHAQLQGAMLSFARMQGADLGHAQLQGADFSNADLEDSELAETFLFKARIADANMATAAVRSIQVTKSKAAGRFDDSPMPLMEADVEKWVTDASRFAPAFEKDGIIERFDRLREEFEGATEASKWKSLEEAFWSTDPYGSQHQQRLAKLLSDLACKPEGAPYVARGVVHRYVASGSLPAPLSRDQLVVFRDHMEEGRKTSEKCPGVAGFTENDWRALEAIQPLELAPAEH